ncbi:hypothetical protein [Demequina sediminicola]|uniref:hypothetical protein n=1 Tax=Demequina sediminicola TaxID=1095026 RepID=UPI000782D1FA|nr:hypothetical protein [Demequina sediminicola]
MTESEPDSRVRRAQALERQRAAESRQAAELIEGFVAAAVEAGIAPERLTVRPFGGGSRYRTALEGWYLKRDKSVGVGTDGKFYVLSIPSSFKARLAGATIAPSDPPLELGKGGRDGESMPMAEALAKRLAGGNSWGSSQGS